MMVRTIQHPGAQIQEGEIGKYTSTVVMNNAYIMGFTDKGPIYDYSVITNPNHFEQVYGAPQSEAEKYLFTAVQSVLANGGTPIVARMPYDNKQCKTYKALKMKWMDYTDVVPFEAKKIDTDLDTPIIPLSSISDTIDTVKSFKSIFSNATVNDQYDETVINNINVKQAVELLSPYQFGTKDSGGALYEDLAGIESLKINGVYPSSLNVSQEAVSSLVASLTGDQIKINSKFYTYDEGFNKELLTSGSIAGRLLKDSEFSNIYAISSCVLTGTYDEKTYYIPLFEKVDLDEFKNEAASRSGKDLSSIVVYNYDNVPSAILTEFREEFVTSIDDSILETGTEELTDSELMKTPKSLLVTTKTGSFTILGGNSHAGIVLEIEPSLIFVIPKGSSTGYINLKACGSADELKAVIGAFEMSTDHNDILGYYSIANDNFLVTPIITDESNNDYRLLTKSSYTSDSVIKSVIDLIISSSDEDADVNEYISKIFNLATGITTDKVANYCTDYGNEVSGTETLDSLIPLIQGTINNHINNGNGVLTGLNANSVIVGFLNTDVESPAICGYFIPSENIALTSYFKENYNVSLTANQYPIYSSKYVVKTSKTDTPASTYFDFTLDDSKDDYTEYKVKNQSVKVYYKDHYDVELISKLDKTSIVNVNDSLMIENEFLISLNTIYNNPKLLNFNEDTTIRLESKLLETPEMGFKYGLYLDSEEVEISNDQYDDLVTVNQFKASDPSVCKYGQDIDDANFIIIDKQKSVSQGEGGNIGYFTTIIDPFDALKVQRLLRSPVDSDSTSRTVTSNDRTKTAEFDHSSENMGRIDYWAYESADAWNTIYDDIMDTMDCIQHVRNADGIYIGEKQPVSGPSNMFDAWSIPLTGTYYTDSISKQLMKKFPSIPLADISSNEIGSGNSVPSIIDHTYSTHIIVAVCKTSIDQSTGKVVVTLVETWFGSLFNEKKVQTGQSMFIGDIINGTAGSDYIEFYRNDYVSTGTGAYDPPAYRRTDVNQIFIKDSEELKKAAEMRGIDMESEGVIAGLPTDIYEENEREYYKKLADYHIYCIDKKEVCIYNLNWESNFTSFSKKESQKIIANTDSLYSVNDGTTVNVAKNFLIDMDRCIKFIKNIDDISLHFICDAGLSTIAQFCDNITWNPTKKTLVGYESDNKPKLIITGGWITQPFDPDNDPDSEDRYITGYESVSTWRKVVEKLTSIAGEIRRDCFAIIDAPRQLTLDGAAQKIRRSKITNDFDKMIGKLLIYISGINSSYVAGYYNWLRTTDRYTGKAMWIPPTSKIIGNYCYLNINNLPWLAPAGLTYGLISGCHAISHNPDYQEEDQIYMRSWNYIKQYPAEGFVIEGQRTLLGKESVFERINVRLLFLDLERYAYNVSRTFKYQVNNSYTREQFVATLKPKFEDYTLRGGIYEYYIKVDSENNTPETIDNNELRGDIFIKPTRLIEFILLNFVGTSTSTNFAEITLEE